MKSTPHKCLGHHVRLAQGSWFTVKVRGIATLTKGEILGRIRRVNGALRITTYRARTLWQLERQMRGLA